MRGHANGPGLKVLSTETWWGQGYCGVCGDREPKSLLPQAVRWWDPDDGWKMGVLCEGCGEEVRERGPQPDDYAVVVKSRDELPQERKIDILVAMGDLDMACSESGD